MVILLMEARKLGSICGIITPLVAYIFIFTAILNAPGFSWATNALSDLGVWSIPLVPILFNTGLIISGLLLLGFTINLFIEMEDILGKIGALVFILDALSLIGVGVFPEDIPLWHFFFSVMFFSLVPIALLIITADFVLRKENIELAALAVICAFLVVIIWAMPWSNIGVTGVAIPEFLSSLVGSLWVIGMSWKMLKLPTKNKGKG